MEVRAPASSPPVQLSAVATVNPLSVSFPMTSAARAAISSGICMSVTPRHFYGGARHGGDALLAPGEAQPLAGRRLDRYPRRRDAADGGDGFAHRRRVPGDLRRLADQRQVEIDNSYPSLCHQPRRVLQE